MSGGALGDDSNARPATYKAAALPAELRGQWRSTSAVPKRERPVGRWCLAARGSALAAHIPGRQHHVTRPRSAWTHPKWSGRRASNSWPRPWRGRALPAELHPQSCKAIRRPVPKVALRQFVKEHPPSPVVRSIDRGPRRGVGRLKPETKKARFLSESGPLRAELGGCAAMRLPLPDAFGPLLRQAGSPGTGSTSPTERPDAGRRRTRLATSSPRHERTRPDPSWVGVFGRCGANSR